MKCDVDIRERQGWTALHYACASANNVFNYFYNINLFSIINIILEFFTYYKSFNKKRKCICSC